MFVKNDLSFEKTISMVKWALLNRSLKKFCSFPEENKTIEVDKYEWQNIRYKVDAFTKEVGGGLGTFVHYPI
jgi:hypothetical protein